MLHLWPRLSGRVPSSFAQLEQQLVRFEAELGPLEKRSARFTEVFNEVGF